MSPAGRGIGGIPVDNRRLLLGGIVVLSLMACGLILAAVVSSHRCWTIKESELFAWVLNSCDGEILLCAVNRKLISSYSSDREDTDSGRFAPVCYKARLAR